jgi:plasmid stabilization system protein ParE
MASNQGSEFLTADLVFSEAALNDLERLSDFLSSSASAPTSASQVLELIIEALSILKRHPEIGRPARRPMRELVISHGKSGYVGLYVFDPVRNQVLILRIRHQRETGYSGFAS